MEQSANHHIASQMYGNLDASKRQHRLIRFIGGSRELAWELGTFSLKEHQPMTALSYCWGRAQANKPITLNGLEFLVRPNLYSFLVQMASETRRDWFFVDAICINQDDIPERSVQVTYMGEIYKTSREVVAWMFFEDIDDPKTMKQADIQRHVREYQALKDQKSAKGQDLLPEEAHLLSSLKEMAWQLAASSEYWSRLWILQEILLAKKLVIRWYSLTFRWSEIISLRIRDVDIPAIDLDSRGRPLKPHPLTTMRKASFFQHDHMPNSTENSIMCRKLWHWADSAGEDLHRGKLLAFQEAVEFFSIQQCGVMHDNVYALLGIAECAIRPDYDMPLMDLYFSALYNYMLSLWSTRPLDDVMPIQTLRHWDMLSKLVIGYKKLPSPGETFMHAFHITPFHELVFLVTYHVCRRLSVEAPLLAVQGLASRWLLHTEYTKLGADATNDLIKRNWYESEDRAVDRFNKDLDKRVNRAMDQLEESQKTKKLLAAPYGKGSSSLPRVMVVRKRVQSGYHRRTLFATISWPGGVPRGTKGAEYIFSFDWHLVLEAVSLHV